MKTILITGGLGFIGSHTCVSLLENNINIIIIDSLINSTEENFLNIKKIYNLSNTFLKSRLSFVKADLLSKNSLIDIFKQAKLDKTPISAVIHLAGLKSVNESIEKPLAYWETNVFGTINLLEVMKNYNCKRIIFSSSATIYKSISNELVNENSEIAPNNPYGSTKVAIENMLGDLKKDQSNDWSIINLRYFNPVGAHISGLLGENPKNKPNNLFPILLKVASKEYENLTIYGNDWPTYDGTCIRDYIHVMDLAEAHVAALDLILKSKPILFNLNIGTGIGKSVLDVVKTFNKINNCDLKYIFKSRREGDVAFSVADNKLALSKLKWSPKRNLNDMCEDAWRWNLNKSQ